MPASTRSAIANPVRLAVPDDIEALVRLCGEHTRFERACYDVEGKELGLTDVLFGGGPKLMAWVAIVHGQAVGYATATEEFSTRAAAAFLHMDCLFVRPGHRNGGLGVALLNVVVQYARDRDLREVQWQMPGWNTDACRFYQRHGGIVHQKVRVLLPNR
jgi:GNAT superfamily N-acetyltransferase